MKINTSYRAAGARIAVLSVLIAGLTAPCLDAVADQVNAVVEIDHATGEVKYKRGSIEIALNTPAPRTVPLRPGESLKIKILNTNTLLYSYGQEVKEEEFVDKTALFKYLGGLQGGIAGLFQVLHPLETAAGVKSLQADAAQLGRLKTAMERLALAARVLAEDARIAACFESHYLAALQASEGTAAEAIGAVQAVLESECAWSPASRHTCRKTSASCAKAMATTTWTDGKALEDARRLAIEARDALAQSEVAKTADGAKLLAETDKVLEAVPARALDLALDFANVSARLSALEEALRKGPVKLYAKTPDAISYHWDKTQTVTITVEKRKDLADKIAYRDREFEKVTFVVSPEWYVQPSIGAGLIWANKLVWPEWTVLEAAGAKTVTSKGMADKRFQFFPLISLTTPALSCLASWDSEHQHCKGRRRGKAVALDLGWNASTSEPAYLVGGSFVFSRQFKIGGGVVWQQRQVLNGIEPGDPVPAAGIPLRQSYPPAPYLMFSILGWPPFTSGQ